MIKVTPAILTNSPDEFEKMLRSVELHFSSVHLDIADGLFVPNTTIKGIDELKSYQTLLKVTVHLMVQNPENILDQWLNTGIEALIFHIESTQKMDELINKTKAQEKKVGIAINPDTSAEMMDMFVNKVDFVHFMTVNPGFYGGEFREEVLSKIKSFRQKNPHVEIRVDGGIDLVTAKKVAEVGADVLIIGSYFFKEGQDISNALENMKKMFSWCII